MEDVFERACNQEPAAHIPPEVMERLAPLIAGNRTNLAFALTATSARLVDPTLHPCSLQAKWQPSWQPAADTLRAYDARTCCTKAMVGVAMRNHVSLGVYKREPLQNKPFGQQPSVYVALGDPSQWTEDGRYLVRYLEDLAAMDPGDISTHLLALVRLGRMKWEEDHVEVRLGTRRSAHRELRSQCVKMLAANSEDGKWGQAFVAAGLELMGLEVRAGHVYASRKQVGDVQSVAPSGLAKPFEVRQKDRLTSDPWVFAHEAGMNGMKQAVYVDLIDDARPLPEEELDGIYAETGVDLLYIAGVDAFLDYVLGSPVAGIEVFARDFPVLMSKWMEAMEVSVEGRRRWASLFDDAAA